MDWIFAVERQRERLVAVLAGLVAMAGFAGGIIVPSAAPVTLPRCLHRAILRLLRPAEAAARRLAIALARTLPAPPWPGARSASPKASARKPPARKPPAMQALPLFDALRGPRIRRPVRSGVPRICVPGLTVPFAIPPRTARSPRLAGDAIDATRLHLRLRAIAAMLEDLPAAARRFARWQARQATATRRTRVSPLRPGRPPGWRRTPAHAVHAVLDDAHGLAIWAMERRPIDTS